ncbi:hypothetical protein [Streptomyces sp. WM6372]|nr:hypothetical protein [Streptomyces sp. WM6372]
MTWTVPAAVFTEPRIASVDGLTSTSTSTSTCDRVPAERRRGDG